ncbi:pectate lyase D [Phytophthora cinnamomi]|uniref:pectate lyase D n=1 Tax=Phytophthora cinnamomi TaxID=4785 RepID=UPI003559EC76|nr:pectate lyase D [Phytophthora cinnamomi]
MFKFFTASVALIAVTSAASLPDGSWPSSKGLVQFSEVRTIKAGEVFDGKMQTFERSNVKCNGQAESGWQTAVFRLEPGATLKNVIIGKNQMEGVHCDQHDCIIENVWWDDVCEDALSIKGGSASSVSKIIGGGARYADDKVIQHNGLGKVIIDGFYGEDVSKIYRSCGTCGPKSREVSVSNVYVVNPTNAVVTVNKNWGDKATLSNIWVKSSKASVKVCQWSQGNPKGEPSIIGQGPSGELCQYSASDVHINQDINQAKQSSPEQNADASQSAVQQSSVASSGADGNTTTPIIQSEVTVAPKTKVPKTKAPKTTTPKTKAPKTKTPTTTAPKATKAPKVTKAPKTKAPKTTAPSAEQQDPEQSVVQNAEQQDIVQQN